MGPLPRYSPTMIGKLYKMGQGHCHVMPLGDWLFLSFFLSFFLSSFLSGCRDGDPIQIVVLSFFLFIIHSFLSFNLFFHLHFLLSVFDFFCLFLFFSGFLFSFFSGIRPKVTCIELFQTRLETSFSVRNVKGKCGQKSDKSTNKQTHTRENS